jgi:hypothetical protein
VHPVRSPVLFIPILSTAFAAFFTVALIARFRAKGGPHLLWWGLGTLTYALGTATEAATTLLGWHAPVFRLWYITGALLGGAPLAQGTVYLLLPRRTANRLTVALVTVVAIAATCVLLSPLRLELVEAHRLSGRVLGWQWVRAFSPFINTYALIFLVGGAAFSAWRYARRGDTAYRAVGNTLIAVGSLLPGIGGTFTRFGHVEVLYVTEFIGLCLLWAGYRVIVTRSSPGVAHVPQPVPAH